MPWSATPLSPSPARCLPLLTLLTKRDFVSQSDSPEPLVGERGSRRRFQISLEFKCAFAIVEGQVGYQLPRAKTGRTRIFRTVVITNPAFQVFGKSDVSFRWPRLATKQIDIIHEEELAKSTAKEKSGVPFVAGAELPRTTARSSPIRATKGVLRLRWRSGEERKGWDSNPRRSCPLTRFRVERLQPDSATLPHLKCSAMLCSAQTVRIRPPVGPSACARRRLPQSNSHFNPAFFSTSENEPLSR